MTTPPSGTVTLLFTDIQGSTQLVQRLGHDYVQLQREHQRIVREALAAWRGYEVDTQGDSFFVAFQEATDAVQAVIQAQRALTAHTWPQDAEVRLRMGLHTGEPTQIEGRYIGLDVNRGARIASAGHGGQVLLSQTTVDGVANQLPPNIALRDMGEHRLKDLRRPRRIFQLLIPDLPSDFPPLKTLSGRRHNLPTQATSLVGRGEDVDALKALLQRDEVRLVTLTGPGGVGKTRLSLQTAAELLDDYPDGVFFVPLEPITDPDVVLPTIAQTLDVQEEGGRTILDALREKLTTQRVLLVLDNFEQVTRAGPLITQLMQAAPRLKAIVTSRAALRVYGEREFPVSPLPRDTAVELFLQRAQMVRPNFTLTPENTPAITAICARLDGLPLAIELAAARVKLLTPQAMLPRLERRLALLTQGSRDLPLRQQTLRASIDWSYDLLDATRRAVFRRLAVFVGGFSLEAAEQMIGAEATLQLADLDILTELEALVNESLVQQREDERGEARFAMLETIREYALEKLEESHEAEALRGQHADYYLTLAETAEPKLRTAEQAAWLDQLETEHDNCRAVLRWTLDDRGLQIVNTGLRIAVALWQFWTLRGHWTEGRRWFDLALARTALAGATTTRATAYGEAGALARAQGDYTAARDLNAQGLALARELGDQRLVAMLLHNLGNVAFEQTDHTTARTLWEESLAVKRTLGEPGVIVSTLNNLGELARLQGDYGQARRLLEESLEIFRRLGNRWGIGTALNNLGELAWNQGEVAVAQHLFAESLGIRRETNDRSGLGVTLANLARLAIQQGDFDTAHAQLDESLAIRREIGDRQGVARSLDGLARVAYHQGDLATAEAYLRESLELRQVGADDPGLADGLRLMGWVAHGRGQTVRAIQLLAVAAGQVTATAPQAIADETETACIVQSLRTSVGDDEFERVWADGQRLAQANALRLALER